MEPAVLAFLPLPVEPQDSAVVGSRMIPWRSPIRPTLMSFSSGPLRNTVQTGWSFVTRWLVESLVEIATRHLTNVRAQAG